MAKTTQKKSQESKTGSKKSKKKSDAGDAKKKKIENQITCDYSEPSLMVADNMLSDTRFIWRTNSMGVRVQMLNEYYHFQAINFVQYNLSPKDPLCRLFGLCEKWAPMGEILEQAKDWASKSDSLVAINSRNGEVVGVLFGRIVCSRDLIAETDTYLALRKEKEMREMEEKAEREAEIVDEEVEAANKDKGKKKHKKEKDDSKKKKKGNENKDENVSDEEYNEDEKATADSNPQAAEMRKTFLKKNKKKKVLGEAGGSFIIEGSDLVPEDAKLKKKHKETVVIAQPFEFIKPEPDRMPIEMRKREPLVIFDDEYKTFRSCVLRQYMKARYDIYERVNLFENADVRCYYKVYVWGVDEEFRNRGIGGDLLDAAENMCLRLEIPLISILCTTKESKRVAHNNGYLGIAKYKYRGFKINIENEKEALLMLKYIRDEEIPTNSDVESKSNH